MLFPVTFAVFVHFKSHGSTDKRGEITYQLKADFDFNSKTLQQEEITLPKRKRHSILNNGLSSSDNTRFTHIRSILQ